MKIKFNSDKQTFSLKGLTPMQYSLIVGLMSSVRLGSGNPASEAAFEFLNAEEQSDVYDEVDACDLPEIEISVTSENGDIYLNHFTIETFTDDYAAGTGCTGNCAGCECAPY